MRNLVVVVAVAVAALAIPFAVEAQQGGVEADGWEARLDRGTDATSVFHFRTMGSGVHATTAGAGAAIFWQPNSMAKGDLHDQRVLYADRAVGSPERVWAVLWWLRSVGPQSAVFVFRDPAGWPVPHQEADGERHTGRGQLDGPRRDQRPRCPGAGDEHARGGGRRQPGALSSERH